MLDKSKKRKRFRMVIPAHPAFNIYSHIARKSTALGPVCIATVVNKMEGWDVEIIDENNLRIFGPRSGEGGADHKFLSWHSALMKNPARANGQNPQKVPFVKCESSRLF